MCSSDLKSNTYPYLSAGEIDLALTVTDAFMVAKSNGRKVRLQGTFVESPLVWAVAARTDREEVVTVADLFGK